MAKGKHLRARQDARSKGKNLRAPSVPDIDHNARCPDFCFHHMRVKGYRVEDCDNDTKIAFIEGLWRRSQLTWRAIMFAPREGLGQEKISPDSLLATIPKSVGADVKFISMKIGDAGRMVGFRDESVFHVVWVSGTHNIYKG